MYNTGMSGAGVYAVAGNYNFDMTDVLVEGNVAQTDGGGLLVITDHESFSISRCTFQYNEALSGTIMNNSRTASSRNGSIV